MTQPMTVIVRAAAPAKAVRQALTDADALRVWLAEHAEVDLPHRYTFWGRYTPEGDAPHQTLTYADDDTLRMTWRLDGVDTTTEIAISEEGPESTLVTLTQSHFDFEEAMSGSSIRGVLQTFWSLTLANLVDYVEGREITPKADFTSPTMRESVVIDAPRDAVYASMMEGEKVTEWFGYPVGIEPWVGGRFAMGGLDAAGEGVARILELEPGSRVSADWGSVGITSWELEDAEGKTRLTFVQSGFDTGNPPYGAWCGWLSGVSSLRRYHELSSWRPIWVYQ